MNKTGYRPALGKEDLPVVKPTFTELKKKPASNKSAT